jgi:hypothetical protein
MFIARSPSQKFQAPLGAKDEIPFGPGHFAQGA